MLDIEVVRRARVRAEADPNILVQGTFCQNKDGEAVSTASPEASCFCTLGLIANEMGLDLTEATTYPEEESGRDRTVYGKVAKSFFGEDRTEGSTVDEVIFQTDKGSNRGNESAYCPSFRLAGLAGFDYLINKMETNS